jgi:MFS superfamily sulfate permease-like transporter
VIKGMLTAIGLIIIIKQIPHAMGYDADYEGDMTFVQADGQNTFSELFHMLGSISPGAVVISLLALGTLILWETSFIKRQSWTQWVQGPLVVVVSGILINVLYGIAMPQWQIGGEHLVQIPSLDGGIGALLMLPDFTQIFNPEIYVIALTLAVVGSLETLLTVEATDKLDPYKRVTPANLELKAQGVGNLISGLIGGLPITQVIVRSSANIQSGGKTRASAFLHGLFLLVCVLAIPTILNMIPLASLAAILIMVGYKLAKPSVFKAMYAQGREQYVPFLVTVIAILLTDLLVGIGIGMAVAIFSLLRHHYMTPYFLRSPSEVEEDDLIRIELADNVSFLNKAHILKVLDEIPKGSKVEIDATRSIHIEHDVMEIIEDFRKNAAYKEINLSLIGFDHLSPSPLQGGLNLAQVLKNGNRRADVPK